MKEQIKVTTEKGIEPTAVRKIVGYRKKYLERLENFLFNQIKEVDMEIKHGQGTMYFWDFDMIQEYIYQDSPQYIFSGALNKVLEYLKGIKGKNVIADGTKLEITSFLTYKASQIRQARLLKEAKSDESLEIIRQKGILSHKNWKNINDKLQMLIGLREIRKLRKFLIDDAVSLDDLDAPFAKISARKLKNLPRYKENLREFSMREGNRRNEADARNITRLQLARQDGYSGRLLTGTRMILDNFSDDAIDAFESLFSSFLLDAYPDPLERIKFLKRSLYRLEEFLDRFDTVEEAAKGSTKAFSFSEVRSLIMFLQSYRQDSVLSSLLEVLSSAYILAKNRFEQFTRNAMNELDYKEILDHIPASELRTVEKSITHLLAETTKNGSLLSFNYTWSQEIAEKKYEKWNLSTDDKQKSILTFEIQPNIYSLHWPVELSFYDFIKSLELIINNRWVPNPSFLNIDIFLEGPLMKRFEASYENKLWILPKVMKLGKNKEIIRIRIINNYTTIFYEPGDVTLNRRFKAGIVDNDRNFRWFNSLFSETCSEYVPEPFLKKELKSKFVAFGGK